VITEVVWALAIEVFAVLGVIFALLFMPLDRLARFIGRLWGWRDWS
jgi:hypothetical protein